MMKPGTIKKAGLHHENKYPIKLSDRRDTIKQDARVINILEAEVSRSGRGKGTLSKVFIGLLSVHNESLIAFARALNQEGDHGNGR